MGYPAMRGAPLQQEDRSFRSSPKPGRIPYRIFSAPSSIPSKQYRTFINQHISIFHIPRRSLCLFRRLQLSLQSKLSCETTRSIHPHSIGTLARSISIHVYSELLAEARVPIQQSQPCHHMPRRASRPCGILPAASQPRQGALQVLLQKPLLKFHHQFHNTATPLPAVSRINSMPPKLLQARL